MERIFEKQKIGIITDDICSLPQNLIEKYQIGIVKTKLYFPEYEKFKEKNIYQFIKETKAVPKTSAPSVGDFLLMFRKFLQTYEDILVITVSSTLSGVYNSAFEARQLLSQPQKVYLFDSLAAATGQGILVLKACHLIQEERNLQEILRELESLREKIKFFGYLQTTYWVQKTGRISEKQSFLFNFLQKIGIRPYFTLKKGRIKFGGFNFWTKDILKASFLQIKHCTKKAKKIEIAINYTDNISLAYFLKEKLEKELRAETLFISLVPNIIGINAGPGALIVGCFLL